MFDGGRRLCVRQNAAGLGEGLQGVVDDQEDDERSCRRRYDPQDLNLSVHPVTLPSFHSTPPLGGYRFCPRTVPVRFVAGDTSLGQRRLSFAFSR